MVLALAGDSTMTRRRPMTRHTVAGLSNGATPPGGRILAHHGLTAQAQPGLPLHRRPQLARAPGRLPGPRAWHREPPAQRGLRPRGQPSLELRPVAARAAALPAAVSAVHGEVGAVLVPARARSSPAAGAFPVRRGQRDDEAIATAVELCARRPRRRDVPRGDAPREGAPQEARGALARAARPGSPSRRVSRSFPRGSPVPIASRGSARCGSPTVPRSRSTTSSGRRALADAARATRRRGCRRRSRGSRRRCA